MDDFLALLGKQALRYAIRSGISLTSTFAIGQCSRLLTTINDHELQTQLRQLQILLESKIKIITPAMDLVEFKSGRGNVFLDSALPLTKSIHKDIASLGQRMEALARRMELCSTVASDAERTVEKKGKDIRDMLQQTRSLLDRIDREIPFLQLAITASGESLSTSLPAGISPSRLLQASTLMTVGDTQHSRNPFETVQIGPVFTLSLYMLFLGHANPGFDETTASARGAAQHSNRKIKQPVYGLNKGDRKPIWQEVIHKARVTLTRDPGAYGKPDCQEFGSAYAYRLEIVEDLDDGRVHAESTLSDPNNCNGGSGIQKYIPIHQISKIFYTDSGRLLNIGSDADAPKRPVLLLKRDINAPETRTAPHGDSLVHVATASETVSETTTVEQLDEQAEVDLQLREETACREESPILQSSPKMENSWEFPSHLDQEWLAMEIFDGDMDPSGSSETDDEDSSSEQDITSLPKRLQNTNSVHAPVSQLETQIRNLSLIQENSAAASARHDVQRQHASMEPAENENFVSRSPFGAIVTSLSLIEMLIRLASLQQFQQASHLSIPDHILAFFLEEASTTGLVGEAQWKARNQAKERVGFDPYQDTVAGDL